MGDGFCISDGLGLYIGVVGSLVALGKCMGKELGVRKEDVFNKVGAGLVSDGRIDLEDGLGIDDGVGLV